MLFHCTIKLPIKRFDYNLDSVLILKQSSDLPCHTEHKQVKGVITQYTSITDSSMKD